MTYFSDWQTEAKSLSESGRAEEALTPVQRLLPLDLTRYSSAGWEPEAECQVSSVCRKMHPLPLSPEREARRILNQDRSDS